MPVAKSAPTGALSFSQLEALYIQAGGSRKLAPTMAAIALAESSGHPNALNDNPSTGDYSVGLWQINYYGALRDARTKRYGSPQALTNPLLNAQAAVDLAEHSSSGLHNWSTYNSGKLIDYFPGGARNPRSIGDTVKANVAADAAIPGRVATAAGKGIFNALGLGAVEKDIIYSLAIGGGGILILLGLAMIGLDLGFESFNRAKRTPIIVNVQNQQQKRAKARATREKATTPQKPTRSERAQMRRTERRNQRLTKEQREKLDREYGEVPY